MDADDIRQLVVAGSHPLWRGTEGVAQHRLGAHNTCLLANSFVRDGFEVVIADVVTPSTARVYRAELPDCLIVHLVVAFTESSRRATTRPVWLTDDEFALLHRLDADDPPNADFRIDVSSMSFEEQIEAVDTLWRA